MAASTTSHRPIKGILKKKGSADSAVLSAAELAGSPGPSSGVRAGAGSGEELSKKSQKWDEMSILATYRPANKDSGFMNINDPNVPYHSTMGDAEDESISDSEIPQTKAPEFLAQRLAVAQGREPKFLVRWGESSEDEEDLRRQFELKRKLHYSEGLNIKLARQLISQELLGDMEDGAPQDQEMQEEAFEMESSGTSSSPGKVSTMDNEDYDISKQSALQPSAHKSPRPLPLGLPPGPPESTRPPLGPSILFLPASGPARYVPVRVQVLSRGFPS
ncbi:protein phosphatase inhibitor 2-like [Dromiciops gliroides]|uniref:protein phosphatase inhibitor 2-like n=1 Tax=Dromiciops gliroides TaxID=33562 RepID=UPI001CC6B812|nr:protein phosphatase inhibitor 2-like [Dromiciops gliroides]